MDDPSSPDKLPTPEQPSADAAPSQPPAQEERIEVRTGAQQQPPAATPAPGPLPAAAPEPAIAKPPQVVVGHHGGKKKRWLKILITLLLIAAVAAGGWLFYQKNHKDSKKAPVASGSKEIPLLKIGIENAAYGSLYPDMAPSSYSFLANAQMFEGLVRYENQSKIVPALASNWTNPDSKTWLFTVKSGVKFHDGNTMTAKDVKYSLDKVIAANSDLAQTFAGTIASVDAVNDKQVKITTKEPDPSLLNRLTFLYIIDANLPKGDEPSMAGTGPYRIKPGTKPTDTSVQMVAADNYHGAAPKVRALSFGSEPDDAALLKAFRSGTYNIVGPVTVDGAKSVKNAAKFVSSEPDVSYIAFNTVKPGPLQNKLVREAIRYAVEPETIGKARGNEITPLSQLIPESIPGYNPSIGPYKRDIPKAKKLLAEAGYPNGLTLRFSTTDTPEAVDEISKELKDAGITVTVDRHADFDEFITYFTSGQAEMYSVNYASDTLDGLDIYTTTLDSANYDNPKLTALLDQTAQAADPAKRLKLLQDAAVVIDQDAAVVPLSTENNLWLMDKNYVIQQDLPSSFISVYFQKVRGR